MQFRFAQYVFTFFRKLLSKIPTNLVTINQREKKSFIDAHLLTIPLFHCKAWNYPTETSSLEIK